MSQVIIAGDTSGTITLQAPAVSGSTTLTLPALTGTVLTNKTAGTVLQVVNFQTGAVATGTTSIPRDNTIPQITEGNEYMSLAITPTNVNNKLKIDVVFNYAHDNGTNNAVQLALFQDSTSNALAAVQDQINTDHFSQLVLIHYMTAGTVSATTFKVRAGANSTGTLTFNGQQGSRFMGGVMASSITITEITA
jgi:hypothetical protein